MATVASSYDGEMQGGFNVNLSLCFIAFCLFVPTSANLQAQTQVYQITHLTTEHNLPSNRATDVVQDPYGFMWIATNEGLARYDGYEITMYRHSPDDSTSISDNFAEALLVDREGTLWVGTYGGGLNRYDPATDSFIRYLHDPNDPESISHSVISTLYEDRAGTIWIGYGNGSFDALEKGSASFMRYPDRANPEVNLPPFQIGRFLEDQQGYLWIASKVTFLI
jgi:ligand-binding sensor domain-containing protein